jgi:hypothetical protein
MVLVSTDVTFAQFQAAAFGLGYASAHEDVTLAASPSYSWIFPYAFHMQHYLKDYGDMRYFDANTNYILVFVDIHFKWDFSEKNRIERVYDVTNEVTAFEGDIAQYDQSVYPYANMEFNGEGNNIEVRIGPASELSPRGIFK